MFVDTSKIEHHAKGRDWYLALMKPEQGTIAGVAVVFRTKMLEIVPIGKFLPDPPAPITPIHSRNPSAA